MACVGIKLGLAPAQKRSKKVSLVIVLVLVLVLENGCKQIEHE